MSLPLAPAFDTLMTRVFGRTSSPGAAMATKNSDGCTAACFLVAEDPDKPTTWHLQVKDPDGKPNHSLMGAAFAALHDGYRGNTYEGPQKAQAFAKLKALYKAENMTLPGGKAAMSATGTADPTETILFAESATLSATPIGATDEMVIRPGKIFETGDYQGQGFTFTAADLAAAVARFQPVPIKLGHDVLLSQEQRMPAVLQGKLGTLARIWPGEDGKSLMGEVHLPKWLDALLDAGSRKVSTEWQRATKTLTGLALVQTPQVSDAALMAAFAASRAPTGQFSRHDTATGQMAMQHGHDWAVNHGAVCQPITLASQHEASAVQQAHDLFAAHGAQCEAPTASLTDVATYSTTAPARRARRMSFMDVFRKTAKDQGVEVDEAELAKLDALFASDPAEVEELKRKEAAREAEIEALRKQNAEHTAAFAHMEQEKRQSEAAVFARTQIDARRVVPAAEETLAALATYLAATDAVATFAAGQKSGMDLLGEFLATQPDLAIFTVPAIKAAIEKGDVALLSHRDVTPGADGKEPPMSPERAAEILKHYPDGAALLAAIAK